MTLFEACRSGNYELVKKLIDDGADVNVKDNYRTTPLIYAAKNGHTEICKLLIDKGADVNIMTGYNQTALIFAIIEDYKEIYELLIENGANINIESYGGGFSESLVKETDDFRITYMGTSDLTPLIFAILKRNKELCAYLISKGADTNFEGEYNFKPLIIASIYGYTDICKLLIENGANVNATYYIGGCQMVEEFGFTALMIATIKGHKEICELLIDAGAELDVSNKYYSELYKKGWTDCSRKLTFSRRKHLLDCYYKDW